MLCVCVRKNAAAAAADRRRRHINMQPKNKHKNKKYEQKTETQNSFKDLAPIMRKFHNFNFKTVSNWPPKFSPERVGFPLKSV